ncbi:hypothetical protein TOTORO_01100 [Serratia phage vB_SmaS-Totoro]|nr:hypothetical protein TOTORO_01100 [Serratia phage vB_SmaS-Totoro]
MANKTREQLLDELKVAINSNVQHCARIAKTKEEAAVMVAGSILRILDGVTSAFPHAVNLVANANTKEDKDYLRSTGRDWLSEDTDFTPMDYIYKSIPLDYLPVDFFPSLVKRYKDMAMALNLEDPTMTGSHLVWMLEELSTNEDQSDTKKHRWLGYIQGILIAHGVTTVAAEREFTRKIFNGA